MLDVKLWLAVSLVIPPRDVQWGPGQGSEQASRVPPHQSTHDFMDLALRITITLPLPNFSVLLASTEPKFVHQTVRWQCMIHHSKEHVSAAPESSCSMQCVTPLQTRLGFEHGDVRLACSCFYMGTPFMKLLTQFVCWCCFPETVWNSVVNDATDDIFKHLPPSGWAVVGTSTSQE